MPKQTDLQKRRESLTNLGHAVIALVEALQRAKAESGITYDDEYQLGLKIRKAIKAGLKADIEGEQRDAQIAEPMDAVIKAVNRHLAREVKKL